VKLASVRHRGAVVGAVVDGDAAYLLPLGVGVGDVVKLGLERGTEIGAEALRGEPVPFAESDLLLPYKPTSIRDFVTFESHVEGVRRSIDNANGVPEAWYDAPHFYFTNPHALYGPGEAIPRPVTSRALDFEMEVGVVVGAECRSATEEEAEAAIFGYTIVNDWSARDLQSREMQVGLGPAKGKDFATSIGPWIVTADGLPSMDLDCRAYVNGELIGHDRLSSMNWTFAQMIQHASRDSLVLAGDLLASGTTGGGGCLAELWGRNGSPIPPPLEPGDVVRLEVEGLGSLSGRVMPTGS
jgi:2-keto-4-pentenoate hydratase/2-oxohepta-3-ene-1,7-dioic acid hydratase in catechol pathway